MLARSRCAVQIFRVDRGDEIAEAAMQVRELDDDGVSARVDGGHPDETVSDANLAGIIWRQPSSRP